MKRIIAFAVVLCFMTVCFAGCGSSSKFITKDFTPENYEKYVTFSYEFETPRLEKQTNDEGQVRWASIADVTITVSPTKEGYEFEKAMLSFKVKYGWGSDKMDINLDENGKCTKKYTATYAENWVEPEKLKWMDTFKLTEDSFSVSTVEGTVRIPYKK